MGRDDTKQQANGLGNGSGIGARSPFGPLADLAEASLERDEEVEAERAETTEAGEEAGSPLAAEPAARPLPPAPQAISDLAAGCVRFVQNALGIALDFQPETLPLLDHYIEQGRSAVCDRPELLPVLAQAIGAYFGEVVRRRHPSWWSVEGDDPATWRVQLEPVYLSFSPIQIAADALRLGGPRAGGSGGEEKEEASDAPAGFELDEEDREAVMARLADLPPVSEEEFHAPSTRLEVIDIIVEAIRARRLASGEPPDAQLRPEDYE